MSEWISALMESPESGATVFLAVNDGLDKFMSNPRFRYRVEVEWCYEPDSAGMPKEADAKLMEQAQEALETVFGADPVAVITETVTGDGVRSMAFQTLSLHIFQRKVNESLDSLPQLPLEFSAIEDPEWEGYREALEAAKDGALD